MNRIERILRPVNRDRILLLQVDRPHVIESHDVVGVRMRITESRRFVVSRILSACCRKSGVVSMTTVCPSYSTTTDGRSRESRGSSEVQTLQSHPRVGTPMLVPDPRTVSRIAGIYGVRPLLAADRFCCPCASIT